MFSLTKLAYDACDESEQEWCATHCPKLTVDLQHCCTDLIDSSKPPFNDFELGTSDNSYLITEATVLTAVRYGHVDCLKMTHEKGIPWPNNTAETAAQYGQLQCLQYLHENKCPWDENTCAAAAKYGFLDCLMYAREHRCPWNEQTWKNAVENNHSDILKYVLRNRCPTDFNICLEYIDGLVLDSF